MKQLVLLFVIFCLYAGMLHAQDKKKKTVLILYSFSQSYPVTSQLDKSIRSVFNAQQDIEISINTEHLELSKYNDSTYIEKVVDLFKYKYVDEQPDLIITVIEPAFNFILQHRDNLFPGVPIIFGGIEIASVNDLDPNVKGIFQGLDLGYEKTLDLAFKLHPNTQQVFIISGSGKLEMSWLNLAKESFEHYQDQKEFTYLTGLSMNELRIEVENLPDNSLVFYLPVLEDKYGGNYVALDVVSSIAKVSSIPVYGFMEIQVGHGIVGGYLKSFPRQAINMANMALNVLSGDSIEKMQSISSQDYNYIFDYNQLKKWSIPESDLPENSEIRYIEYTFWEMYIYRIMLVTSVIVVLLIIIGYLLAQKKILRNSQKELSQAQRKYKTVADYTSDWEYWQNTDGSMAWVSPSCEHICGYASESIARNPTLIHDIIMDEDKQVWDAHNCNDNGKIDAKGIRFRIRTKQGEIRWVEHACQQVIDEQGNNLGVRAINRNITEREKYKSQTNKLQSELIHVERVATISALTYTLAHEINQPLTSIRSYAQAALRFMYNGQDESVNIEKALQGIVSDNKRAAAVVNQLRDLVKKKDNPPQVIDINKIVSDVLGLLNSEIIIQNAIIKLSLDQEIHKVNGDPIQLQQVFLNLISNGLDAMIGLSAGKKVLAISTSSENSTGTLITISDTGIGITVDKLEEIFEAFHTSKSDGLGLGLAISKSIIESHGGKIWAEKNEPKGTKIVVFLPRIP